MTLLRPTAMRTMVAKLAGYFRLHEGVVLSRDRLAKDVWGLILDPRSRCIDQTVSELKRQLEDGERIITVHRVGYRYVVPTKEPRGRWPKKNPAIAGRV